MDVRSLFYSFDIFLILFKYFLPTNIEMIKSLNNIIKHNNYLTSFEKTKNVRTTYATHVRPTHATNVWSTNDDGSSTNGPARPNHY